uniref:pre-peptidase C-terminal domain-containing protein n=1 Tax=Oceanithermus sp. TaxID=2268145 RepID=UPI00257C3643
QIDPGRYAVYLSGPNPEYVLPVVQPGTFAGYVDVNPGYQHVSKSVNVTFINPYEANDDTNTATTVATGETYISTLYSNTGADKDYFALVVKNGETYVINTETLAGNPDLKLTLIDSNGTTVIDQNDSNQSFSSDAWLSYTANSTKTVYILVEDASGTSSPFNVYALDIASPLVSELGPNGSATVNGTTISNVDTTNAQSVDLGSAVNASIDPAGDDDIFMVSLTANTTLVVDVETVNSGEPDTMLAVYDSAGNMVAFNDDFTGRESRLEFTPSADGTYYVLVTSWDGDGEDGTTGNYILSLTELVVP